MPTACERRARFRQSLVALVPLLLGFLTARPCPAADDPALPERWQFRLTTSVMAADHSGTTTNVWGRTVGGHITYAERDYSELFPYSQPLYLVEFAASRDLWGIATRGQLLDWENDVHLENRTLVQETMWFLESDLYRNVGAHWTVLVGLRYFELEHSEEFPYPPGWGSATVSWDHSWLDPVAGATFQYPLAREWEVAGRGDVGGFGIGSDLTWDVEVTIQWAFASHVALIGGYRVFDVDFSEENTYGFPDGSRLTLSDTYDTRTEGPTLGLTFHW